MAHGDDHNLLEEESGVEEIRPRQGTKFVRLCLSALGCMALAGGGYLAGRRAAISTESLAHMIGELGVPQTVEEAKQFYTQTTKDMTLAEKAAANSNILAAAATVPDNQNLALLHTWYNKGAAASDKTIMNHFLYDALISAASPAPKANPAPAQSASSYREFGHQYSHETAGKPWPQIVKIDDSVRDIVLPSGASPAVQQLNHWYQHRATAEEKQDFDNRAVEHKNMGIRY